MVDETNVYYMLVKDWAICQIFFLNSVKKCICVSQKSYHLVKRIETVLVAYL